MNVSAEAVLEEAVSLPEVARWTVVEGILASFGDAPPYEEHLPEILARKEELDSGTVAAIPGDVVRQRVLEVVTAVHTRLAELPLGIQLRDKDWRPTAGRFPRDAMTLAAERHGRQWRKQSPKSR